MTILHSLSAPFVDFVTPRPDISSSDSCTPHCISDESIWEPEHVVIVGSTHVTAGMNDRCRCMYLATRQYNDTSSQSSIDCQQVKIDRLSFESRLCPLHLPSKTGNDLPRYASLRVGQTS